MITITANSIIIPQGETGSIAVSFKNSDDSSPLVLMDTNLKHKIVVKIKDKLNVDAKDVIEAKEYDIKNNDNDLTGLRIFDNVQYVDTDKIEGIPPANTLYIYKTGTYITRFFYTKTGDTYNRHEYDFSNSSINIDFAREDTLKLAAKTYYLEISHITTSQSGDQETKHTLLAPIDFIVKGALI